MTTWRAHSTSRLITMVMSPLFSHSGRTVVVPPSTESQYHAINSPSSISVTIRRNSATTPPHYMPIDELLLFNVIDVHLQPTNLAITLPFFFFFLNDRAPPEFPPLPHPTALRI